jgi:WS/DGAT/MGAT family acyltransferase
VPSGRELLADNLHRHRQALGRALSRLARPGETLRQVRAAWPALRESFAEQRAPRTSLNRPIGSDRRLAVVRSDLDLAKRVAHAHGGTVNDVLLAAVAGGLRELLGSRGEPVDGLVLRAFVPVSLHHERPDQARGNLDGAMFVPLPVGVPDPVRRLRLIIAETTERKQKARPAGGTLFSSRTLQRAALRLMARQRLMNVYITNVPGPPVRLYFAGAPLLEAFPVVPIMANVTLGVGALTYAGQLNVTAVADRDTCPDADVFAAGLQASLQALAASLLVKATDRSGAAGRKL